MYANVNQGMYLCDPETMTRLITSNFKIKKNKKGKKSNTTYNESEGTSGAHMQGDDDWIHQVNKVEILLTELKGHIS